MEAVTKETVCPYCNRANELVSKAGPGPHHRTRPKNGDAAICNGCGRVAVFDSRQFGGLRRPNERETQQIAERFDIRLALAAWRDAQ